MGTWMVVLAALLLSQSKTNWLIGAMAGIVVVGYRSGREPGGGLRLSFVIAVLLGLAALCSLPMFFDMARVYDKFMETDTGANLTTLTGRTEIWAAAAQMWKDSPLFGYGLGAWAPAHRIELHLPFATHAHNQLMQALAVGGIADALPMLIYVSLLIAATFRAAARTRGVSLGLGLFFLIRCVTEAPLDFSNLTSADVVAHLVLFAIVVNEYGLERSGASATKPIETAPSRGRLRDSFAA
jgi:O-antigen ligase